MSILPPERKKTVFGKEIKKKIFPIVAIGLSAGGLDVENHHGFISATGELNKGTTINIYLPVDLTM